MINLNEKINAHFGIPKRFAEASFENYIGEYKTIPDSCLLWGIAGTGKTHLAIAKIRQLFNETTLRNSPSAAVQTDAGFIKPETLLFVPVVELLREIRHCFDQNAGTTDDQVIDKYSSVNYLILDDLGAEKATDFVRETLYCIIDRRYRNMLPIIITTNLSLEQISERFDDRLASRLAGMCEVIHIQGEDRRLRK